LCSTSLAQQIRQLYALLGRRAGGRTHDLAAACGPLLLALLGRISAIPVVAALALYSLLPLVRNAATGLSGVDAAVVESAQGVGMGAWRRLWSVELPLAWPIVITGIRVSPSCSSAWPALGAHRRRSR
jgi:ABC-type proline/glycine betaine transport system permease subunit